MDIAPVMLEGRLLRLESLEERHAEDLWRLVDGELFTYMPFFQPPTDDRAGVLSTIRSLIDRPGWHFLAMVLRESGRAVGVSSYNEVRPEHRGVEIGGTWIVRPYQGTHVNPECKFLMLRHAFEDWGAIRVQLKTDSRNLQSRRAIEKLGAKPEGILRKHMLLPDGYERDSAMYSITHEEWPDVRESLIARLGYDPSNISGTPR